MKKKPSYMLIIITFIAYSIIYVFLAYFLRFEFLQSDVLGYWQDSINWQQPFHSYHVPGYPFIIALVQMVLGDLVMPVLVMQLIVLSSYLLGIYFLYKILSEVTKSHFQAEIGCLLYGLYPFVGITYAVYPLADLVVMMLYLGGCWFILKENRYIASAFWGMALITHKAIWPFIGLALLMQLMQNDKPLKANFLRSLIWIGVLVLPLTLLWLLGAKYHDSFLWIIRSNLETEITTRSSFPVMDGIIGTFTQGGLKNYLKFSIALLVLLSSGYLVYASMMSNNKYMKVFGLPIALSVLILVVFINQYEIWAAIRFSRLLILPAVIYVSSADTSNRLYGFLQKRPVYLGLVCGLLVSNVLYAWYMARVFFT